MSEITKENFTSISYLFEVVDFSNEKKYNSTYYPTLNVELKLTFNHKIRKINESININLDGFYFNNPQLTTSKDALKSRIHSITATSLREIKISTLWDVKENGDNNVLKIKLLPNTSPTVDKEINEEFYLTIKYYTFCPSSSEKMYCYKSSSSLRFRNREYRKKHQLYTKDFMIPVIDSPETHTINFKFITPTGWKFHFPYAHKPKKENPVLFFFLEKRDVKDNNCGDNRDLLPSGLSEEEMFKDMDGKSLLSHHWEYTDSGKSTWIISIYKENYFKEVSKSLPYYIDREYLYPQTNRQNKKKKVDLLMQKWNEEHTDINSYLIHSISFNQYAGSKNIIIAYGSYMLVTLSLIFTAVFTMTLFYLGDKGIDYVNSIFAIIGLVTVLLAYFFSYKTQRDNKTISCIPDRKIQHNITIATALAILCAVILLGFRIKTLILG